jgi:hypothetical protein
VNFRAVHVQNQKAVKKTLRRGKAPFKKKLGTKMLCLSTQRPSNGRP